MSAGGDDDDDYHRHHQIDLEREMAILGDRYKQVVKRLDDLEKKQESVNSLINKGLGGAAALMGIGIFVGWITAVGGNVTSWFKGH